jgi:hypothetical protein
MGPQRLKNPKIFKLGKHILSESMASDPAAKVYHPTGSGPKTLLVRLFH